MQPISDNIDFIINGTYKKPEEISHHKKPRAVKVNGESKPKKKFYDDDEKDVGKLSATKELESFDLLEMGALMYIRGRSLPDQIIIIDEAQNTTAHEIRTIITRAGEGTKIILTGDPSQIDAPYLNHNNNGLSYVANKFKSESIAAHIVFKKSERSELAEIAARILI
jgi:PhoH-like ATPase